jgi:hypothetical protein
MFEQDRSALLSIDELGRMTLELKSSKLPGMKVALADNLHQAFDEADRLIRLTWPDSGNIVKADARWREMPPSARQIAMLKELGSTDLELAQIQTMGQARTLIERRRLGIKRRVR